MELLTRLFSSMLVFVYHCFDRIVIHDYLSGLSRAEQVVYFFRHVIGVAAVDKEVLSRRTDDYRNWVKAYARNHKIPIEWANKGLRKEDYVRHRMTGIVVIASPSAALRASSARQSDGNVGLLRRFAPRNDDCFRRTTSAVTFVFARA